MYLHCEGLFAFLPWSLETWSSLPASCCWDYCILWGPHWAEEPKTNLLWFFSHVHIGPKEILKHLIFQQALEAQTEPSTAPSILFSQADHFGFLEGSWAQVQYLTLLLSCQPERTHSKPSKWSSNALSPGLGEGVGSLRTVTIPSKKILYKSLLLHFLTSFFIYVSWLRGPTIIETLLTIFFVDFVYSYLALKFHIYCSLVFWWKLPFQCPITQVNKEKIISDFNKLHEEMEMGWCDRGWPEGKKS